MPNPSDRVKTQQSLETILTQVSQDFGFGTYISHKIMTQGYEDLNVVLTTDQDSFFLKLFADWRTNEECQRYVDIMQAAVSNSIHHPKLFSANNTYFYTREFGGKKIRLAAMEFIPGKTFHELQEVPSQAEKEFLITQVAQLHSIPYKPWYLYDDWATVNIEQEYLKIESNLLTADKDLILPVINQFREISIEELPHCLVHGDLIKPNVLRPTNGDPYLLDFSVANYYPRVLELALMLCNLFFSPVKETFLTTYKQTLDHYQKFHKLTDAELTALPVFLLAAHAMHIIGATKVASEIGTFEENEFWLKEGREGLKFTLGLFAEL